MKRILLVFLLIAALINPVLVVAGDDAAKADKPAKAKKRVQKTPVKKLPKTQEDKNTANPKPNKQEWK